MRRLIAISMVVVGLFALVVTPVFAAQVNVPTASALSTTAKKPAFSATLTVSVAHGNPHTPKINTHVNYVVRVLNLKKKPMKAKISVGIVDPLGTFHKIQFDSNSHYIVNYPINGTFKNWLIMPPASTGFPLYITVKIHTSKGNKTLKYLITPRQ